MSKWITWLGGTQSPVPGDTLVQVRYACGETEEKVTEAEQFDWSLNGPDKEYVITAYRVVSPAAKPNDGSTADYYVLPVGAAQLQDLISYRNMNAQMGEIMRAVYRYGQGHHSSRERDLRKIIFYAKAELDRLEKYEKENDAP